MSTAHPPGHLLKAGRFRIEAEIGSGGFGITYRATRVADNAAVVIKELFPGDLIARDANGVSVVAHGPDDQFAQCLDRFIREAEFLKRLDHPNIVRVDDTFLDNGTAYFSMPHGRISPTRRLRCAHAIGWRRRTSRQNLTADGIGNGCSCTE